jgi:hypothetical protein
MKKTSGSQKDSGPEVPGYSIRKTRPLRVEAADPAEPPQTPGVDPGPDCELTHTSKVRIRKSQQLVSNLHRKTKSIQTLCAHIQRKLDLPNFTRLADFAARWLETTFDNVQATQTQPVSAHENGCRLVNTPKSSGCDLAAKTN